MSHPAEMFYAEAQSGYQRLVTVGVSEHFNSAANPQFTTFMDAWRTFVAQRPHAPVAVFEGDIPKPRRSNSPLQSDENVALCADGDLGLLSTLAYKIGADVDTGAPQSYADVQELLQLTDSAQIDRSVVAYYYWARHIPEWRNVDPQPSLEDFFNPHSGGGKNRLPYSPKFGFDFSYEAISFTHKELYGTALNPETLTLDHEDVQTVAWLLRDVRDLHLGRTIVRLWNEGSSPFVLCQRDHLENWPVQECLKQARIPNYSTHTLLQSSSDTLIA